MHSLANNKNQIWQWSRSLGDNEVATSLGKGGGGEGEGAAGKALQKRILLVCTALMGHQSIHSGESPQHAKSREKSQRELLGYKPQPLVCDALRSICSTGKEILSYQKKNQKPKTNTPPPPKPLFILVG